MLSRILPPKRYNTLALIIGSVVGIVHLAYHAILNDSYPGDYVWALRTAYTLINGIDSYAFSPDPHFVPYPLPVALFGFPLIWLVGIVPMYVAGSVFIGVSSGILSWALLRAGEASRLAAILLSGPFWVAVIVSQWSPLIVAAWYLPVLAPLLVLIKPQIAFPVAAARWPSRLGLLIAASVLLLSLLVDVTWPWRFLQKVGPYQSTIPILALPLGPLLALAGLRWRDEKARLLLLMSVMPQRAVYDFLPLWIVPKTSSELMILSGLSWLVVLPGLPTWPAMVGDPDIRWAAQILYLSVLAMLFWRRRRASRSSEILSVPSVASNQAATASMSQS